jgi:hypothetical protein
MSFHNKISVALIALIALLALFAAPAIATECLIGADSCSGDVGDSIGVRSMYWGAGEMEVDATGCTVPSARALVTSGPTPLSVACSDSATATISGSTVMPDGWNASTVTFELTVGQIAASTGTYAIHFEGQCIGSDEPFLAFAGTGEQIITITLTADDDTLQGTTPAVTLNGTTCAAGDVLVWRGAIHDTTSTTSLETLAVVVGVKMEYTSTVGD